MKFRLAREKSRGKVPKFLALLLTLTLLCSGCSAFRSISPPAGVDDTFLTGAALLGTRQAAALAEPAGQVYTDSEEIRAILARMSVFQGATPTTAYVVTLKEEDIRGLYPSIGQEELEELLAFYPNQAGALLTRINSALGTQALAAGSILQVSRSYSGRCSSQYLLFYFLGEDGPAMATAFYPSGEGIVTAVTGPVCAGEETVRQLLAQDGLTMREVAVSQDESWTPPAAAGSQTVVNDEFLTQTAVSLARRTGRFCESQAPENLGYPDEIMGRIKGSASLKDAAPQTAYIVEIDADQLLGQLGEGNLSPLSQAGNMPLQLCNLAHSRYVGNEALAASGALTSSQVYAVSAVPEKQILVVFFTPEGACATAFTGSGDGLLTATSVPLYLDGTDFLAFLQKMGLSPRTAAVSAE